ncbi:hypothetical protein QF000_004524 [Paraburkholderia atlantica]|uniref:hypothetical protein n=1 Tax=Paraburkholderia atlantica TaxID=2654982 RepID=UPI003D206D11
MLSPDSIELVLKQKNRKHEAALARAARTNVRQWRENLPLLFLCRKKTGIFFSLQLNSQRFKQNTAVKFHVPLPAALNFVRQPDGKDKSLSGRKG